MFKDLVKAGPGDVDKLFEMPVKRMIVVGGKYEERLVNQFKLTRYSQ